MADSSKTRMLQPMQWFLLAAIIMTIAGVIAFTLWFSKAQVPDYLYKPTRYAFISDAESPKLSVVDLEKHEVNSQIDLSFAPDLMSIATDFPMLAYAGEEEKKLVFYNLKTKRSATIDLPSKPIELFFLTDQQTLLVVMEHDVAFADYQRNTLYPLSMPEDVGAFSKQNLPVFSPLDSSIWVSDPKHRRLLRLRVNQQHDSVWEGLPVQLPGGMEPGPLAVNPQGDLLAFADHNAHQAWLYYPDSQQLKPLGSLSKTASVPVAPFIDANYQSVMFAAQNGQIAAYQQQDGSLITKQQLPGRIQKIRGGWLNHHWTILSDKGLGIVPARGGSGEWFDVPGQARDLWVTGNGKTALITVDSGQQQMMSFDIKDKSQIEPISIRTLLGIQFIRMGGNNSFCY